MFKKFLLLLSLVATMATGCASSAPESADASSSATSVVSESESSVSAEAETSATSEKMVYKVDIEQDLVMGLFVHLMVQREVLVARAAKSSGPEKEACLEILVMLDDEIGKVWTTILAEKR